MKKALSLILALVMCLPLCACGGGNENTEQTPDQTTAPAETTMPAETTEPTPISYWNTDYYVDAFGDSTGDSYMVAIVDGTFSNTATMGSDVKVIIYYSEENPGSLNGMFSFRLLEYGDVKATFSKYDDINIQIKDNYGVSDLWELYGSAPNGDIYDTETYISAQILQDIKLTKIDVPAIITIGSSTYKFTIPFEGFDATYEEYKNMD